MSDNNLLTLLPETKDPMGHSTDLLSSPSTDLVIIECTTKCNLRCVYCTVSQPENKGKGQNIEEKKLDKLLTMFSKRRPGRIVVNGHGETTIYPGWQNWCKRLIEGGHSVTIISNFAKKYSHHEIEVLSHFSVIEISCDTADPELFAKLRRGARFDQMVDNITKIRAFARSENRSGPIFSWSCVVSDKNVFGLISYVEKAAALKIKNINLCNLIKPKEQEGLLKVNHVVELPKDKLRLAAYHISSAYKLAKSKGINMVSPDELQNTIIEKIETDNDSSVSNDSGMAAASGRYHSSRPHGYTRDCLDPWRMFSVRASGEIGTCCGGLGSITTLKEFDSLDSMLNSANFKKVRNELLSGDLRQECQDCSNHGWILPEKLAAKVVKYQKG